MTNPHLRTVPKPNTIKGLTCELLCEVVYFEDKTKEPGPKNRVAVSNKNRRSVGHPYQTVAEMVKETFPDAKVSADSVRRTAGRIRADEPGYEGYLLPGRRPRANSK